MMRGIQGACSLPVERFRRARRNAHRKRGETVMTFMVGGIQTCHGRLADTKPSSSGADRGCRTAYCRFLSGPAGGALGLIVTPRLRSSSTISLAPALPLSARIAVSRASASSELRSLPEPESGECKVYRQPADWKTRPLTTRGVPGAFTANAGYAWPLVRSCPFCALCAPIVRIDTVARALYRDHWKGAGGAVGTVRNSDAPI